MGNLTDKKPTDAEIVKALECCHENSDCGDCMFSWHRTHDGTCVDMLHTNALDLINRLQAENESLEISLTNTRDNLGDTRAELNKAEAENERLEKIRQEQGKRIADLRGVKYEQIGVIHNLKQELITAKAEAYKEFAERLKNEYSDFDEKNEVILPENIFKAIDDLLKELVGEDNG